MKFLEAIQSKFKTAIISGLVGLLGVVATALYKDTAQAFVNHVFPAITQTTLLCTVALLFAVCIVSIAWLIILLRQDRPTD